MRLYVAGLADAETQREQGVGATQMPLGKRSHSGINPNQAEGAGRVSASPTQKLLLKDKSLRERLSLKQFSHANHSMQISRNWMKPEMHLPHKYHLYPLSAAGF